MNYPHKHVGDQCFKCGGHFEVKRWVGPSQWGACQECPKGEHLHLGCNQCGYWVWEKTLEQRQLEVCNEPQR